MGSQRVRHDWVTFTFMCPRWWASSGCCTPTGGPRGEYYTLKGAPTWRPEPEGVRYTAVRNNEDSLMGTLFGLLLCTLWIICHYWGPPWLRALSQALCMLFQLSFPWKQSLMERLSAANLSERCRDTDRSVEGKIREGWKPTMSAWLNQLL